MVRSVAFSPDGKTILTGCKDKTARLWDATTGQPIGSPILHPGEVLTVTYSPDGSTIFTTCSDRNTRLWDATTHHPIDQPFIREPLAFSPDGKAVISRNGDAAQLYDVDARQPIGPPMRPQGRLNTAAYSPDGKSVVIGCLDGTAQCWNAVTGKPDGEPIRGHRLKVWDVAVSPDGRTALTASEDKTARLWDVVTNQPIGLPLVHLGPVVAVAFSPDGKSFLTASSDTTVRLWDADPGQPFGLLIDHEDLGQAVAFSRDGKSVFTGRNTRHRDAVGRGDRRGHLAGDAA